MQILWVIITSIIGYAGIYFLFRAFDKIATGIALIVAYLSTFIMYFVNIRLIDSSEIISVEKIILAIAFFIVISWLLFIKDKTNKKLKLNIWILFAIGTALCWSFYFSANTYFIKTNWMSPSQSLLLTEWWVAISAIIFYIYKYKLRSKIELVISYRARYLPWIIWVGSFLMASVLCKYYGYKYLPSALVNVARLFSIAMTTFFCRWWYGEKLQKKEILFIMVAFILLVLFLMV
jgi:drug/metabolite transporter (DMT)-like permease